MTFPLRELADLMTSEATLVGVVVGIEGAQVRVATQRGGRLVRTQEVLQVGDRVLLREGLALRAPTASRVFPV